MNVHLLTHLSECVRKSGPLWAYSMFSFESMNGKLLKLVNGTQDITQQIAEKYCLSKIFNEKYDKIDNNEPKLYTKSEIKLTDVEINLLKENDAFDENNFVIFTKLKLNHEIYTTINYKLAKRTADYFLSFEEDFFGIAKYFFKIKNIYYVMIEKYHKVYENNHMIKVKTTTKLFVKIVSEIKDKYMYVRVLGEDFITSRPNKLEH